MSEKYVKCVKHQGYHVHDKFKRAYNILCKPSLITSVEERVFPEIKMSRKDAKKRRIVDLFNKNNLDVCFEGVNYWLTDDNFFRLGEITNDDACDKFINALIKHVKQRDKLVYVYFKEEKCRITFKGRLNEIISNTIEDADEKKINITPRIIPLLMPAKPEGDCL